MRSLANDILRGERLFGSDIYNTEEFNIFFNKFKNSFTRELKKINATSITFSKGHFYLSGFFTVQEQIVYFSISDVRGSIVTNYMGLPQMLVRTAKSYNDYTGGSNNFVVIKPNMSKQILKVIGLDQTQFKLPKRREWNKKEIANKIISELENKEQVSIRISSTKKANRLMWEIGDILKMPSFPISITKYGRSIFESYVELEGISMRFNARSNILSILKK